MNLILKIISATGLALTLVPAFLVFADRIPFDLHTRLMVAGMILWFASAPFWMKERDL